MTLLETARVRYSAELPAWEAHARDVEDTLVRALHDAGIGHRSEARAKSVASFVKKAVRRDYEDPWSQTGDKAGVRVTVTHNLRVDAAVEVAQRAVVEAGGAAGQPDDRRDVSLRDVQRLDYLGVHLDLDWPVGRETGELLSDPPLTMAVEVQVRSEAQSLWASVGHPLVYKPVLDLPATHQRSVYRLLALVELFDAEVDRAVGALFSDPGYPEAVLLDQAEQVYLPFQTARYDRDLSLQVLRVLTLTLHGAADRDAFPDRLHEFAQTNAARLTRMYEEYGAESEIGKQGLYPLVGQPESVVLLQRLSEKPALTHELWAQHLPEGLLTDVQDAYGSSLPD